MTNNVVPHSDRGVTNIALVGAQLANWSGGNDFLRICAGGLWQMQRSSPVTFSLLLSEETPVQLVRRHIYPWKRAAGDLFRLRKPTLSRVPRLRQGQVINAVSSFGAELNTVTYSEQRTSYKKLSQLLVQAGFDVALPISSYRGALSVPWIGYIPDLQHRHYPEFFSSEECSQRDDEFSRLLQNAGAIIVNSIDARDDIERTYPEHQCTIFNLPFAPILNPSWLEGDPTEAVLQYKLPRRYFLVSNQFWVHKSHITAFEALAQLGSTYGDVVLICTGSTSDFRHPEYFRRLKHRVAALKLEDKIRILGLIPKFDQIQIMRGAVAVVQPTLFEGGPGGGSVYDAICTGTPVILSDIPINREIEDETTPVQFFERRNAEDLADKMRSALESPWRRPSNGELRSNSDRRAEALGSRLLEACDLVRRNKPI